MKSFRFLASVVAAIALASILAPAIPISAQTAAPTITPNYSFPLGGGMYVYIVRYGDTVDSIAAGFGISVQVLMQANGLAARHLYVGQRLSIPSNYPPPASTTFVYVVQRGDTLYSIAWRFGTTVAALTRLNRLNNPNFIFVGMRLLIPSTIPSATPTPLGFIPTATPTPVLPPPYQTYFVQPGDTLTHIALRYGTSVYALMIANNIPNPNLIFVGTRLIIP